MISSLYPRPVLLCRSIPISLFHCPHGVFTSALLSRVVNYRLPEWSGLWLKRQNQVARDRSRPDVDARNKVKPVHLSCCSTTLRCWISPLFPSLLQLLLYIFVKPFLVRASICQGLVRPFAWPQWRARTSSMVSVA